MALFGLVAAAVLIVVVALAIATRGPGENTAVARLGTLEATVETVGRLVPTNPVVVRSALNGQVSLVAVEPGDTVQAGDVLVELDQEPFEDALRRAQQQLEMAETSLNLARMQGGDNPTPEQIAARLQAEQGVRDAQSAVNQAETALVNTLVLAPTDGTVLQVQTAALAPVGTGAELVQIANLADLTLQVDLDEIDLPHVEPGMPISFTLDAYPGREIDGTLDRIAPTAQTSGGTTTFRGTVSFTAPDDLKMRPGMNANVSIQTTLRSDVLLIPESALRTVGQRTFVTLVIDDDTEEREIQVGLRSQGQVEVAAGLEPGDRVVIP